MRIQNDAGFNVQLNTAAGAANAGKTDGKDFSKVLANRLKSSAAAASANSPAADRRSKCFADLVRDSFANPIPQALSEVEKMAGDETGDNIDMRTLDDLLDFIVEQNRD